MGYETINISNSSSIVESNTVGICNTCKNSEICINIGDLTNPKWHCEGFDCNGSSFMSSKNQSMDFTNPKYDSFKSSSPVYNTEKYRGLCLNCDNNEICNLLMPESGVWYCEEYK